MTLRAGPGTPNAVNFREYAAELTPWIWRDGADLNPFGGVKLMTGGWNSLSPFDGFRVTNEEWTWDGSLWTMIAPNDRSTLLRPPPQHTAPTFLHNGKLFTIGSDIFNGPQNNTGSGVGNAKVWRRASLGSSWELRTDAAEFGNRVLHCAGSGLGKLWCGLGQADSTPGTAKRDWWGSADEGTSWQRYADFPGAARGLIYNPFEWNGEMIVIGGGTYDDDPANRTLYNGVYAFNGTSWRTILADGHTKFSAREYHRTGVFAGAMFVANGFKLPLNNIADFNWSDNGEDWNTRPVLWSESHADGLCVDGSNLYLGPGNHGSQSLWRVQTF